MLYTIYMHTAKQNPQSQLNYLFNMPVIQSVYGGSIINIITIVTTVCILGGFQINHLTAWR